MTSRFFTHLNILLLTLLLLLCASASHVMAQQIPEGDKGLNGFKLDYPELPPADQIPKEHLLEMQKVYEECEKRPEKLVFKNCRCYSMQYLAKRLETPTVSSDYIHPVIRETCNDPGIVAGYYYNTCFNNNINTAVRDWEKLCTCYANYIARETIGIKSLDYSVLKKIRRAGSRHCEF